MASSSGSTSDSGSSLVWRHFEKLDGDKAKCKLCHNNYSRKGSSTSGLMGHLRSMHKSNYKTILEEEENRKKLFQSLQKEKTALQEAKLQAKQTSSLTSWMAKDISKTIDYRIAEMICLDDLPLNFVEGLGFHRFVSKALPNYKLKGRTFYSNLVHEIYDSVSKVVRFKIKNMKHKMSFTIDEWSETSANISLLSLTCHGITENFKRVKIVLCAKPLYERKTGEYIAEQFSNMITFWDIPDIKIHAVVRDSGANIKNALKLAKVDNYDCTAHKLQLVVNAGIDAQRTVKDMIAKCKRIASHFNHSIAAQDELKKKQIRLNLPELRMLQDVATRWNSTFYMLKRALEIKESLSLYLTSSDSAKDLPIINSNEWNIMQKCIDVLAPFEHLTRKFSEPSASIADVIPMIATLRRFCEDKHNGSDLGVLSMKETLRSELDRRFSTLETVEAYAVATYLDPRYKGKVFSNVEVVDQTKQKIVKLCVELSDSQETMVAVSEPHEQAREVSTGKGVKAKGQFEASQSFQDCLKALISGNNKEQEQETESEAGVTRSQKKAKKEISIINMIEDYELKNNLDIDENPLSWWNDNKSRYSLLSEVVQSYLACPPTSVPSEQLFSGAGLIYTPQRNRLKGENAEKLLFLKYNLPFINFEYEK